MIELTERTRSRWLWGLAAVTAAYGLANVLVYFTTGGFGPIWFAAGVAVYSLLLASAVALSLLDPGRDASEAEAPETPAEQEPPASDRVGMVEHETVYTTRTGRVLRARFGQDGSERSLLFAVVGDEVLPVSAVEEKLGDVASRAPELEDVVDVEEALARRSRRPPRRTPDPGRVDVDLEDREVLHEGETGRVLRARYRADDEEFVHLFAITEDTVVPVGEIDGSLDEIRVDEIPVEAEAVFEEMLARGANEDPVEGRQATVSPR